LPRRLHQHEIAANAAVGHSEMRNLEYGQMRNTYCEPLIHSTAAAIEGPSPVMSRKIFKLMTYVYMRWVPVQLGSPCSHSPTYVYGQILFPPMYTQQVAGPPFKQTPLYTPGFGHMRLPRGNPSLS
jgi:hypothetical protein